MVLGVLRGLWSRTIGAFTEKWDPPENVKEVWYHHTWFLHSGITIQGQEELDYINNNQWKPSLAFKKTLMFIPASWVVTTVMEAYAHPTWDPWLIIVAILQVIELVWYAACVFLYDKHTKKSLITYYLVLTFTQSVWPILFSMKNLLCYFVDNNATPTCRNTGQHELYYLYMYLASFYSIVISEGSIVLQSLVILFLYVPSQFIGYLTTSATKLQYLNSSLFLFGTYASIHGIGIVLYETKRKTYYLKIQVENEMALRKRTVSYIFHELRNPLSVITLAVDSTNDKGIKDTLEPCVVTMESILNDALDMDKMAQGSFTLHPVEMDFNELLTKTLKSAEPLWTSKGQEFSLVSDSITRSKTTNVLGDKVRIRQIILNYVSNASKYTEEGGQLSVRVSIQNESASQIVLLVEVSDSGVGISEADQKTLFQDFVQINNKLSGHTRGTGLGLSVVASLVRQMGGEYGVKSTLGVGSTFWCTLPLEKVTGATTSTDEGTLGQITQQLQVNRVSPVLVVDDNAMIRKMITGTLRKWGLDVDEASNGQVALDKMSERDFKLVLLDDNMPVMSGQQVMERLGVNGGETVNVIGITGDTDGVEKFTRLGARCVLVKPISNQRLLDALNKL